MLWPTRLRKCVTGVEEAGGDLDDEAEVVGADVDDVVEGGVLLP